MKRFTATEKWDMTWFHELDPVLKCLWQFMCDRCDAAGVWEPNWTLASFLIGKKVTAASLSAFGDRIIPIKGGKLWLRSFIEFQYGKLSRDCRPHIKIFESLNKHGIEYTEGQELVVRSRVGHVSEGKRKEIYARDGEKCVYCGSSESLEPDHIIPRSKGGDDKINNLVTACHECNTRRGDRSVEEFLSLNPEKERVLEYLHRVSNTLEEEEEDKDKEEDKETDKEGEGMRTGSTDGFDEFWRAYPKRKAIGDAQKAWVKNDCAKLLPQILASLIPAKASHDWKKEAGQFIPHPATWLNRRGWEDEYKAAVNRTCPIPEAEMPTVFDPTA